MDYEELMIAVGEITKAIDRQTEQLERIADSLRDVIDTHERSGSYVRVGQR